MAPEKPSKVKTDDKSGRTIGAILRRAFMLYVVIPCLAVCGIFVVMQRSMLYPRTQVDTLHAADANFPAGQVHDIGVVSDDGLRLRGWLALAEGQSAQTAEECDEQLQQGRPLVLFFPGNGDCRLGWIHECRVFTHLGADVVLFDYRGYGDNPGSPSEAKIMADALVIWKNLVEERQISHRRIIIVGRSLGGAVATRLAAQACQNGQQPAGLVLMATFSSMVDTAAHHYPLLPVRLALLDRYESTKYIGAVTCPIACLHGAADQIVPLHLGKRLFEAAPLQSASGIDKSGRELP